MKNTLGIIPARYASTRFPGKPLAEIRGKPMVQWVYERASEVFDHLYVATDDQRIKRVVKRFGGRCVMTSQDHQTGTERCLEAYMKVRKKTDKKFAIVVNVQGDEPLVNANQIRELVSCFDIASTDIATLIQPISADEDPAHSDIVKVVVDRKFRALYFSRCAIPFLRDSGSSATGVVRYKHIGMYGFRTKVLKEICSLPQTRMEVAESLEQLRWLEYGYRIQTRVSDYRSLGVDTPDDLDRIEKMLIRSAEIPPDSTELP